MQYVIKVGSDAVGGLYVVADLSGNQWSAPARNGMRLVAPRSESGLKYVLSGARRRSERELFEDQRDGAISVEEARAL